jgi:ABC-type nitrate/sulfonate/bicarbonate transport system permease component
VILWKRLPPLGLPLIIVFWWCATRPGAINPMFVPPPEAVFHALARQAGTDAFWIDMAKTTMRAGVGLAIAAASGVPLGLLIGRLPALHKHLRFPIDFIRSIPSATLFPLFILSFGIGDTARVAVAVYGCFFVILIAAIVGAQDTADRKKRISAVKSLGATTVQVYKWVVLPDALASVMAGLRIAVSFALVLVVITEMFLGSVDGLGRRIYDAYLSYQTADLFSALIALGVVGYIANLAVERLQWRLRPDTVGSQV